MGFTSALGQIIDRWYGHHISQTLRHDQPINDYPLLRNYTIGIYALRTIENLAVIFALVASCYYSLTGDLLSNSDQMYALLGVAAASVAIDRIVDMKDAISDIKPLPKRPSSETLRIYLFEEGKNRKDQLTARTSLATLFFTTLIAISALFAVIISCYYFQTNNLLSSDLEAHLLMAGGAALLIVSGLLENVTKPVVLFQTLDTLSVRSKAPAFWG